MTNVDDAKKRASLGIFTPQRRGVHQRYYVCSALLHASRTMSSRTTLGVALASFLSLVALLLSAKDLGEALSPQGCRMSWMSPSYVLQPHFNASWTPLARRYSLWLYREVGWDAQQVCICVTLVLKAILIESADEGWKQSARSIHSWKRRIVSPG